MALYRYINSRRGQTSVIPDLTHDNGSTASRGEDKANLLALKLLKAYNSQTDELPYFAECSSSPAPPLLLCRLLWGSTGKKLLSILVTEFFIYHPRFHSSRFFKEDCSIFSSPFGTHLQLELHETWGTFAVETCANHTDSQETACSHLHILRAVVSDKAESCRVCYLLLYLWVTYCHFSFWCGMQDVYADGIKTYKCTKGMDDIRDLQAAI